MQRRIAEQRQATTSTTDALLLIACADVDSNDFTGVYIER
jgi:hypothetical protein